MDETLYPEGRPGKTARSPRRGDLKRICAELNRLGARYMVVGGFAVIEAGYPRFTGDIDLLVDASLENEARVFEALRILPDQAVNQLAAGDVFRHAVVRIADEVVIDLMANACGIDYAEAEPEVLFREIDGVRIPFAKPELLLKMKQTVREKDIADRVFLKELLNQTAEKTSAPRPSFLDALRRWWQKNDQE